MYYFTLQVKTGNEIRYIEAAKKLFPNCILLFPQRRMIVRRNSKQVFELAPLFSGYIFLETENNEIETSLYCSLRKISGFYRFLKDNANPIPLSKEDTIVLQHFIDFGKIAEPSLVYFNENQKIIIKEGPLQGLEGKIVKIDKRKQRVKVALDLYEKSFLIDLAVQFINPKVGDEKWKRILMHKFI